MRILQSATILLSTACLFFVSGCVAQDEYNKAVASGTQASHDLTVAKGQRDDLQQENNQLHGKITTLESALKDTSDKLADARQKELDANEQLVKTRLDLAQSRKETEDAQKLVEAQKQVAELTSKLAAQQAEISKLQKDGVSSNGK